MADKTDNTEIFDYTGPAGTQGVNGDQENLTDELKQALETVCRAIETQELQSRINLVTRVQKSRFFQRGVQYLMRQGENEGGTYTVKYSDPSTLKDKEDRDPMYVFNLYWAYGRSFTATFAQAACGVEFEGNDPRNEADTTASTEADNAKKIVCKVNNQRDIQKKVAKLLWTDPYAVFLTRESCTGNKFGFNKDKTPRKFPEIEVDGALEWKVPIASGDFDNWPYMRRQKEISLAFAKEEYPDKKSKISGAGSSGMKDIDYSRCARLSTQEGLSLTEQSGDAMAFVVTRTEYWLRPSSFNEVTDEKVQATLREWFPNGAYVAYCGNEYCRSRNEDLNDHLAIVKGDPGEGYATPGLGDILMGPQESFNDLANLSRITFLRGVPHSYFDQELIPADAVPKQQSTPGCKHPVAQPADGQPLENHFFEETPANTPVTMNQYMEDLKGPTSQFLSGQQPALFGGEMGEAGKTASGYGQALAQAMGQMTIVWVPFKMVWAKVIQQAVGVLAKIYEGADELATTINAGTPDAETVTLNPNNLKGMFLTTPDTDENFPESWSMQRANLQGVMAVADKSPELGKILLHPENVRMSKNLLGLKNFVDPEEDSRDKQSAEIDEMLKEPPVPTPEAIAALKQQKLQAQQQGIEIPPEQIEAAIQQMPMQSSVDVDPDFDDHAVEWETVRSWINSAQGRKIKATKPKAFENVRLHGLQHKKLMEQAQAPAPNPAMAALVEDAAKGAQALTAIATAPPLPKGAGAANVAAGKELIDAALKGMGTAAK